MAFRQRIGSKTLLPAGVNAEAKAGAYSVGSDAQLHWSDKKGEGRNGETVWARLAAELAH
jgi:hypothetical protein